MKKIIIALLVVTAGYALRAQETAVYKGEPSNKVSGIPEPVLIRFMAVHTDPASATWETKNGWWHASYRGNETSMVHVYYSMEPYYQVPIPDREVDFKVILPVVNTYIPPYIITKAITVYGTQLYSITKLKMADNQDVYQLGLIENGNVRTVWMNPELNASISK